MSLELPPRRLVECEIVIKRGLSTFIEVGEALLEIRDAHLYRETHGTFEDYCRERWDLKRQRAYELMQASEVVGALSEISDTVPLPARESAAAELAPLRDEPTQLREAWSEAVERNGEKPTAAQVREIVNGKRAGTRAKMTQCPRCKDRVRLDKPHKCPGAHQQLEEALKLLQRAYEDMCNHQGEVADLAGCLELVRRHKRLAGKVDDWICAVPDRDSSRLDSAQRTIEGVGYEVCASCGSRLGDFEGRPSYCYGCSSYRDGRHA